MVKKMLLNTLALIFLVSVLFVVGSRLLNASWGYRPTGEEMKAVSDELIPPLNSEKISTETFSRLTFTGIVNNYVSDSSADDIYNHFLGLSEFSGWKIKRTTNIQGGSRVIFCSGDFAHDVEISPAGKDQTRVRAGSYWFSERGDDRFCRNN